MLSPNALSSLFNGWATMLVPMDDFETEDRDYILDWEEVEDEELGPYESPSPEPVLTPWSAGSFGGGPVKYHAQQSAWAALALALQSLSTIVGGKGDAHQHNTYGPDGKGPMEAPQFSFRFVPGADGWQCSEGERL